MNDLLGNLNHYSGLLLLLIAVGVWACALALFSLKSSIECLHEDFDNVHNAHLIAENKDVV